MGQNQSTRVKPQSSNGRVRAAEYMDDKGPRKVVVEKPKLSEGHSILQVPHTNIKIMHVDTSDRAGIVPSHGYIALQVIPPEDRVDEGDLGSDALAGSVNPNSASKRAAKRQRDGNEGSSKEKKKGSRRRSGSLDASISGKRSGGAADAEEPGGAGGGENDEDDEAEMQRMLENARHEYNEEEHRIVTREVKRWKAQFVVENSRPPTKKDIASNPFIYEQYYREKELDAMKKLIDENEEVEALAVSNQPQLVRELTELEIARSEFDALELLDLTREIKKWKTEFKATNQRPPTKRDVAQDPELYKKYYRVKELEAMKKLMDDAEAGDNAEGAALEAGDSDAAFLLGSTSAGALDAVENAKLMFDAAEYARLTDEVHAWKKQFKDSRGRPPTKRDISEDPEMFTKYYREKELEAMKKLIEDSDAIFRKASLTDDIQQLTRKASAAYDADEHQRLSAEIRAWKLQFKEQNGRAPNKRDINQDPELHTKYFREKELEALKKLIGFNSETSNQTDAVREDADVDKGPSSSAFAEAVDDSEGDAGSVPGKRVKRDDDDDAPYDADKGDDGHEGDSGDENVTSTTTAKARGIRRKKKQHRVDVTTATSIAGEAAPLQIATSTSAATAADGIAQVTSMNRLEFSATAFSREASAAVVDDGEGDAVQQPKYKQHMPPPLVAFARPGSGGERSKHPPSSQPSDAANDAADVMDTVVTQFVFPRGHQAAQRVFFFDAALQMDEKAEAVLRAQSGASDPVSEAVRYELEEDEIYEMAGIHRPPITNFAEDEDPLASYEVPSNVLEALRLAIDAPMQDFMQMDAVDETTRDFVEQAILDARELFEADRVRDNDFQKTYSVAHMSNGKSSRSIVGKRLMSKVKSRMSTTSHHSFATLEGNGEAAAPAEDEDEFSGWSHEELVKERKKMHKKLNQYKNDFMEKQGRAPEPFEMAQDPSIRDVFSQYHKLKKRTKMENVVDAVMLMQHVSGSATTAASAEGGDVVAEETRNDEGQPTVEAPAAAAVGFNPFANRLRSAARKVMTFDDGGAAGAEAAEVAATIAEPVADADHEEPSLHTAQSNLRVGFNPFGHKSNADKVLEEPTTRRTLAPLVEAEPAKEPTAEERELDILGKEVKLWKRGFKQREGRNPTRRDIKAEPDFFAKYTRVKELEGLLGKEDKKNKKKGDADEDDDDNGAESDATGYGYSSASPSPGRRRAPRDESVTDNGLDTTETYQLRDDDETVEMTPEMIQVRLTQTVEGEIVNRRDVEADEMLDWKMIVSEMKSVGIVFHDAEKPKRQKVVFAAEEELEVRPVGVTPVMHLEDPDVLQRPTSVEGPARNNIAGWTFPSEAGDVSRMDDDSRATADDIDADDDVDGISHMTVEQLKERRKDLSQELNQWKAHFKMLHNRPPAANDIKAHPQIKKLYGQYQQVSEAIQRLEKQQKGAAMGSKLNSVRSMRKGNGEDDDDDVSPLAMAKRRRAKLAHDILDWRTEFKVHEGRAPNLKDIAANETISAIYAEYTALNDQIARSEGGASVAGDHNETVALALRRKDLGRKLNEWKANFFDTYGRNPNMRDIKTDKQASLMFEEYNLIPKNVEDDATQQLEKAEQLAAASPEQQLRELKVRKKELNKILTEWKANFQSINSRKPKVSDILADPVVSAVFAEFQELQATLSNTNAKEGPFDGIGQNGDGALSPQPRDPEVPETDNRGEHGDAAPDGAESPQPAPEESIAKRKKRVNKQLNAWKAQFKEREGKNPTKADIKKDPEAFALFQEYQSLKDQLAATGGDGGDEGGGDDVPHQPPPSNSHMNEVPQTNAAESMEMAAADVSEPTAMWERRQAPFAEEVGSHSPAGAEETQGTEVLVDAAAPVSQEGPPPHTMAMDTDDRTATAAADDNHNAAQMNAADDGAEEAIEAPIAELKSRKKALNHRLNAWKSDFHSAQGRAPKMSDIQKDPEMLMLYEDLKLVKQELKKFDGGGDRGDE